LKEIQLFINILERFEIEILELFRKIPSPLDVPALRMARKNVAEAMLAWITQGLGVAQGLGVDELEMETLQQDTNCSWTT
jgi:hypothetical protein